jgi:hypothetical protein
MKKIMTHFSLNFGMIIIVIHSHFAAKAVNGISYLEKNWPDKLTNINLHLANYLSALIFIYNLTNKFLRFYTFITDHQKSSCNETNTQIYNFK